MVLLLGGCDSKSLEGEWRRSEGMGRLEFAENRVVGSVEIVGVEVRLEGDYDVTDSDMLIVRDPDVEIDTGNGLIESLGGQREIEALVGNRIQDPTEYAIDWKNPNEIVLRGDGPFSGAFERLEQ
jgi:hypothetical protein